MPLIRLPLIVIDENALRTEALLEPALWKARTQGAKLLLIDMAFLEMAKNQHWEITLRRSLAILSKDPDHVCLGTGIPDLFRREGDSQQPCFDQIVDEERTATVRELLDEVASGRDTMQFRQHHLGQLLWFEVVGARQNADRKYER